MDLNQIFGPIRQGIALCAVIAALLLILKATGFVPIRLSIMELAAVTAALGLAR